MIMYKLRTDEQGNYTTGYYVVDYDEETGKEIIITEIVYSDFQTTGISMPMQEAINRGKLSVEKLKLGCDPLIYNSELEMMGEVPSDDLIQRIAFEFSNIFFKRQAAMTLAIADIIEIQRRNEAIQKAAIYTITPSIKNDTLTSQEIRNIISIFPQYVINQSYSIGDIFVYNGALYEVIQSHTSQADWNPETTSSLYKNHTPHGEIYDWVQPIGAFDAYQIGDKVMYNGQIWICISGDSEGNNVWKPDVFGWEVYEEIPPDVIPDWVQPLGSFDAYQIDDIVTHNEQTWICIVPNNTWEPGVYGWEVYNE